MVYCMVNDHPSSRVEALCQELRRGVIVLTVLARLEVEHYGYELREDLGDQGLDVPEGTLYPLLRRLESQGLLESRWQLEGRRPRRYYKTSANGLVALKCLGDEWASMVEVVDRLLKRPMRGLHGTD